MRIDLSGQEHLNGSVVALGMFDGLHLGHRTLLLRGRNMARRMGVPLVVSTFAEHPLQVIAPEHCPPMLMTLEERIQTLKELEVDLFSALPFNEEMRRMPPEDFVGHLVRRFHPKAVICGYNHTFGDGGRGNPVLLEALGNALGFETVIVPKITLDGEDVSSTEIRGLIQKGNLPRAAQMLKQPYFAEFVRDEVEGLYYPKEPCKMMPPAGKYRVLLDAEGHTLPLAVHLHGNSSLRLPRSTPENCVIRFIRAIGDKHETV